MIDEGQKAPALELTQTVAPEAAGFDSQRLAKLDAYMAKVVADGRAPGMTTFLVTNGTRPWVVRSSRPFQTYVSLDAPDEATYRSVCRPADPSAWELVRESLALLGSRRSA